MGPDPVELLQVARLLLTFDLASPPSQAQLRRAVSTAYYALFHQVLRAGAEQFMGSGAAASAGYALLYRGFSHGRIKAVCESLSVAKLSKPLQQQLGRTSLSREVRDFASAFPALQELRHMADYDPARRFALTDSIEVIQVTEEAMTAFRQIPASEKADILALMLVSGR